MSQAVPMPINKTLVVDPLCDQQVEAVFAVEKSASIQNFYNIQSNNVSPNSITYVINCNSETTITDRIWMNDVDVVYTITFANAGQLPPINGVCLRPFALANTATSIVLQQGNASTSIQSSEITTALQRYGFFDKYLNYAPSNPSQDMTAPYEAGQPPFTASTALVGNKYQERVATSSLLEASYDADKPNVLTVKYRILEPVLISPLLSSLHARREGLRRISQYQLQYNFGSWNRSIAICPNATDGTWCSVASVSADVKRANLSLLQAIPAPLDVGRNLSTQIMPYTELVSFNTSPLNLKYSLPEKPYGEVAQFSSAVIQVSRIPEGIYIFCRPTNDFYTNTSGGKSNGVFASDTFATYITSSLSVNFNGVNQFQNCSDISLYRLCRQNGCNIPWPQWSSSGIKSFASNGDAKIEFDSGVGSVIYLKLSKDITLDSSLAPSCNTKVNLQIQCSFANNISVQAFDPYKGESMPFSMYTVIEYSGCQETYSSNTVATTIGVLSTDDVLTATKRNERVHYSLIDDGELYGGASWLDKAKKFLTEGKLRDALVKLKSYFTSPLAKEIFKTGKEYLREREGADQGTSQIADALEEVGLGMSGGKRLSKAQLRKALLR